MAVGRPIRRIRNARSAPLSEQRFTDALSFLMALINSPDVALELKLKAAISLLPFQAVRVDERGKKERAAERAEKLASEGGPFAPPPPPRKPN
jgi:hypothetical protein